MCEQGFYNTQIELSQSGSTRDNLDQLGGNTSLTGTIVLNSQLVDKLTSVLGSVLHSRHTGGLLRRGVVKESQPHVGGHVQFVKGGVGRVLVRDLLIVELAVLHGLKEAFTRHNLNHAHFVGDGRQEFVVVNNDVVGALGFLANVLADSHAGGVVDRVSRVSN